FGTRLYAAAAGVGVVAAVLVYGRPGPGGSAVVLADVAGGVWWIGPIVIALLVVAVPGRRRRTDPRRADGILDAPAKEEDPAP
ncbi:MAG TPA: mycothiol biosynthesis protein, partial [Amnibacterium sp.]|nr:mycothiol biosynthesis protein [Amnibacterium sp.]